MDERIILDINREFAKLLGKEFNLMQTNAIMARLIQAEMKVIRRYERINKK